MLFSLQNLVRKLNEAIGPGISQIIFTLVLCDLTLENGSSKADNKATEISALILDILTYIFDNLHIFISYMGDDFEPVLNLLVSLSKKSKLDIVYKTVKFEEHIYNLFWNSELIEDKLVNPKIVLEKIEQVRTNSNKLYFSSENLYFQSSLKRLPAKKLRIVG